MSDQDAGLRAVRGYVVFREEEPGLWIFIGDVDYQPGLAARAARVQAVEDAGAGSGGHNADSASGAHAALPRDQWHVLRYG